MFSLQREACDTGSVYRRNSKVFGTELRSEADDLIRLTGGKNGKYTKTEKQHCLV